MKKPEEEILRLIQSGLPPEQLRAEMTRRLVQQAEAEEPEWGALLRAAAIPRRLDQGVVGVLRGAPDDADGNRAALQRLAAFPLVLADPEGRSHALHEEARATLLADWQAPERRPRYVQLSRALWAHFQEQDPLEALYHRFPGDPAGAFDEFEGRFYEADRFYRRAECGALLAAADEQERELEAEQRLWLRYYRARLAQLLDRWAEAEAGYRELLAGLPPSPRPAATPLPRGGEGPGPALSEVEGERGLLRLRTWTLHGLGMALDSQGKWAEAAEAYREALQGWRDLGDRHGEGQTLNNLGIVYQMQGRWDEAIQMYEESLRIFRTLGDRHGEAQTLTNLGLVYADQGRWDEAIQMYQESLRIFRTLGDRHGEGQTLNNLGIVYQMQGRWAEAIQMYEESLRIKRELGDRFGIAASERNLGLVYEQQGYLDKAQELIQSAHEAFVALGSPEAQKTAQDLQRLSGKG